MPIAALSVAALSVLALPAFAADQTLPRKAPPPVAPATTWAGFYVGASVGYGAFLSKERQFGPGGALLYEQDAPTNGHGPLVSGFAGYDYQFAPSWVAGVFAEYEASDFLYHVSFPGQEVKLRQDSSWWLGGRVGYAPNCCALWFVSAGYTRAHNQFSIVNQPPPGVVLSAPPPEGWFIGAGVEAKLGNNLALRGEYRFAHFKEQLTTDDTTGPFDLRSQRVSQSGRVALLYRFGDGPLPAARAPSAPSAPMYVKARPSAPAVEAPRWTGFYLGGGGGYGIFHAKEHDTVFGDEVIFDAAFGGRGVFGTVLAGYDYQVSSKIVVGAFADYDFASTRFTQTEPFITPPTGFTVLKHDSTWSVGGRVGYLVQCCTMLYAAAGYSNAHFNANFFPVPPYVTVGFGNFPGWFVAGGAETKLTNNLAIRFEYRYARFDEKQFNSDPTLPAVARFEPTIQTGRAAVLYRFN
jgi:outer membrane immunogenic protein